MKPLPERRTTLKFHWYKTDKNFFYHWRNNIIIDFDFCKCEMRIELDKNAFGGDYKIEEQISKNDKFRTFLVSKKLNESVANFNVIMFNNHKKVMIESENADKILFVNGKVVYDGMKIRRLFEEDEEDSARYNENIERESKLKNELIKKREALEKKLLNQEKLTEEELIILLKNVKPEIVEIFPNNILFYWFVANNFKYYLNNKVGLLLFNPITEAEELELKNYKRPTNEVEDFRYNYLKTKSLDTYIYNKSKIGNKFLKEVVKQFKTENPDWRKSLPKDDVLFYKKYNCKTLEQENRYKYCYVHQIFKIEPIEKLKWIINNHKDFKEKTVDELINFIKISDDEFQETLHLAKKAIPLTEKEIQRFNYLESYVQDSLNFIKKLNLNYITTTYTVEKIVAEIKGEISPLTNYITEFREIYKKYCERQQEKKTIFSKDENIKPVNINVVNPESIKNIDEIKNNLDKFIFENKSILNVYNYIVKNDIDIDVIKKICNTYLKEMSQFSNINSSKTLVNRLVDDMDWWANSIDLFKCFKKSEYDILSFEVKGAFTEECKKNLLKCDVYDTLILLDEEYNQHDKNAISINFEDEFECFMKIGYVPRELTSKVRNIEKNSPLTFIFIAKKVMAQRIYVEAEILYQTKPWALD